jgi:hypothetical protein
VPLITPAPARRAAAIVLSLLGAPLLLVLTGCQATFTADIRNETPQPLFAAIRQRTDDGRNPILAQQRLGPGDRGSVGPVRAPVGRALLVLDTRPNPQGPWTTDLRPGITVFSVTQKGDQTAGPLEVRQVAQTPP